MWQCYECGEEFEVPGTTYAKDDTAQNLEYEYACCPCCGSDDINEL